MRHIALSAPEAKVGWDYITYHGHHEQFRDSDLWLVRHFLVVEAHTDAAAAPHADADAICEYFEQWNWVGGGVILGTDLDPVVQHSCARWQRLQRILSCARYRVLSFGSHIPLDYLETHYNVPERIFGVAQSTDRCIQSIDRLKSLLAKWKPAG